MDVDETVFPLRDPGLPRFAWLAGILAVGLALLSALRPPQPRAVGAADGPRASSSGVAGEAEPDPVAAGREVFLAQGCAGCHALEANGGGAGPALDGLWARAAARIAAPDYLGGARDPETYLREAVLDHCLDPLPGYTCPDLDDLAVRLSVGEVDALLAYLRSVGDAAAAAGGKEAQP
jgi:nitric oxide reductase subunit C